MDPSFVHFDPSFTSIDFSLLRVCVCVCVCAKKVMFIDAAFFSLDTSIYFLCFACLSVVDGFVRAVDDWCATYVLYEASARSRCQKGENRGGARRTNEGARARTPSFVRSFVCRR